jgi:hypothetical protein
VFGEKTVNIGSQFINLLSNILSFFKPIRFILYILSGSFAALIGWNLSTIIIDVVKLITNWITGNSALTFTPDFIVLPCLAFFFAIVMVGTEIFLSNPTRNRNNWRKFRTYFLRTLLLGIFSGVLAAIGTFFVYKGTAVALEVKRYAWGIVGLSTGFCESLSWLSRREKNLTNKSNLRILKTSIFGLLAGLVSAIFFAENLPQFRISPDIYDEPFSFFMFGSTLGLFLSFATSPTFQVALRAGEGLEAINPKKLEEEYERGIKRSFPMLKQQRGLRFVVEPPDQGNNAKKPNVIEEGLSILLPINRAITIGGDPDDDIYLPQIPESCAKIRVLFQSAEITIDQNQSSVVILSPTPRLKTNNDQKIKYLLRHNQVITFKSQYAEKLYRFVFYDRFLDPQ